jgi:hypothetical protein
LIMDARPAAIQRNLQFDIGVFSISEVVV